jgi:flagellar biosynthesis/type III secretory pathway M-ring protein FliF/YscJ
MDRLKEQLQRVSEQLNGLSASQKMLTASLLAIMVMTLFWWARYAASPELLPVLDRSINPQEMMAIEAALRGRGIEARIVNDRIMVAAERRLESLAVLGYANKLPMDSADAWDDVVKQISPWDTSQKTSALFNRAKQQVLSQLIEGYFPDVISARVVIEPTSTRQIGGRGGVEPSASVFINARAAGKLQELANAAAATVANAQAGLSVSRVSVLINGRSYRPQDPSGAGGISSGSFIDDKHAEEARYADKIRRDALAHIPNALVSVYVAVDVSSTQETRTVYDRDNTVSKEKSIDSQVTERVTAVPAAAQEPGAQANLPLSDESAVVASAPNTETSENTRTQMENFVGQSVQQINKPAGSMVVTGASVRVPRSFFVNQFKLRNPSAAEPDDAALEPLIAAETRQIQTHVARCCGLVNEQDVAVSPYPDQMPPMAAAAQETPTGSGAAMTGMLRAHVKEIAIGGLALISLFMVMSMVRKGTVTPVIAPPVELSEVVPLATDENIAGEAGEGAAMLDGMELDDDTIKAQQMVQQVSTMVKENPEGAASLVRRWLERT